MVIIFNKNKDPTKALEQKRTLYKKAKEHSRSIERAQNILESFSKSRVRKLKIIFRVLNLNKPQGKIYKAKLTDNLADKSTKQLQYLSTKQILSSSMSQSKELNNLNQNV